MPWTRVIARERVCIVQFQLDDSVKTICGEGGLGRYQRHAANGAPLSSSRRLRLSRVICVRSHESPASNRVPNTLRRLWCDSTLCRVCRNKRTLPGSPPHLRSIARLSRGSPSLSAAHTRQFSWRWFDVIDGLPRWPGNKNDRARLCNVMSLRVHRINRLLLLLLLLHLLYPPFSPSSR